MIPASRVANLSSCSTSNAVPDGLLRGDKSLLHWLQLTRQAANCSRRKLLQILPTGSELKSDTACRSVWINHCRPGSTQARIIIVKRSSLPLPTRIQSVGTPRTIQTDETLQPSGRDNAKAPNPTHEAPSTPSLRGVGFSFVFSLMTLRLAVAVPQAGNQTSCRWRSVIHKTDRRNLML